MYKLSVSFSSDISNKWRQVCSERFLLHTKVRDPTRMEDTDSTENKTLPLLVLAWQRGCPGSPCLSHYTLASRNKLTRTTGYLYYSLPAQPRRGNTWLWKMKLFRLSALQSKPQQYIKPHFLPGNYCHDGLNDHHTSDKTWNATHYLTCRKNAAT